MAPRTRPYRFYDAATAICAACYRRSDAKIVFRDGAVWMLKRCPVHGPDEVLLADDIDYYRRAREVFVKTPERFVPTIGRSTRASKRMRPSDDRLPRRDQVVLRGPLRAAADAPAPR